MSDTPTTPEPEPTGPGFYHHTPDGWEYAPTVYAPDFTLTEPGQSGGGWVWAESQDEAAGTTSSDVQQRLDTLLAALAKAASLAQVRAAAIKAADL